MNCPSRPDSSSSTHDGYNQSPHPLALETNNDRNGLANRRAQRDHKLSMNETDGLDDRIGPVEFGTGDRDGLGLASWGRGGGEGAEEEGSDERHSRVADPEIGKPRMRIGFAEADDGIDDTRGGSAAGSDEGRPNIVSKPKSTFIATAIDKARKLRRTMIKFGKFVGPGFMVAVAYIDPGNYATDVAAGASYKFQLLVMILVSNIIAIFLQSLCIKLGSVTGMDLAQNCKAHCPPWLNIILYIFAEAAIIATDIAEVIGTAIALNLLIKVPLVAGCAISIVDVLIILAFYHPSGSMRGVRLFEIFVALLVLAVVVCFCIELSLISVPDVGQLFRGYLPSDALIQPKGLYQACGILGATVMPHSLYLGSGIVQPRLYHYDLRHGHVSAPQIPSSPSAVSLESTTETTLITTLPNNTADSTTPISLQTATRKQSTAIYRPTLSAIKSCLSYSIAELTLSLFTFALFVNSAILIIAGASLSSPSTSDSAASASLFDIHALLSTSLSPAAGTIFALALLLSGTSAGIVCTIAGQMVSEGQLNWSVKPWVRRLITRSVSITPSIIIAGAVGKEGLSSALEASQVALSVILPVVSAPLIWFTMRKGIMTVRGVEKVEDVAASGNEAALNKDTDAAVTSGAQAGQAVTPSPSPLQTPRKDVDMANNWFTSACAIAIWLLIVVMNVASWVLTGKQQGG